MVLVLKSHFFVTSDNQFTEVVMMEFQTRCLAVKDAKVNLVLLDNDLKLSILSGVNLYLSSQISDLSFIVDSQGIDLLLQVGDSVVKSLNLSVGYLELAFPFLDLRKEKLKSLDLSISFLDVDLEDLVFLVDSSDVGFHGSSLVLEEGDSLEKAGLSGLELLDVGDEFVVVGGKSGIFGNQ